MTNMWKKLINILIIQVVKNQLPKTTIKKSFHEKLKKWNKILFHLLKDCFNH